MTHVHALERPLRAWRSFRDLAHATRTLAAAQALKWNERVRHAERHLAWCEAVAAEHPLAAEPEPEPRVRVVLAIGSDLGLCGALNRAVAERCVSAGLDDEPTVSRLVIGTRLASATPLREAIVLPTPSSLAAARRLAVHIEGLLEPLPATAELTIVLAAKVEGDGHPRVEVRSGEATDVALAPPDAQWLASTREPIDAQPLGPATRLQARHARLVAALCRAVASENEARWRVMARAHDSAQRRIGEQERKIRRMRQELITREMLEARQGSGR